MASANQQHGAEEPDIHNEQEPYIVAQSENLGRYMIAARDLKMGDIIFEEYPIVSGPQSFKQPICPGCYKEVNTKCTKCGCPICGDECPQKNRHERTECGLFREASVDKNELYWDNVSNSLMIYRCLTLPKNSWEWKALHDMETHSDKWAGRTLTERERLIIPPLRECFHLSPEEYTTEEIFLTLTILYINAFEVRMPDVNIQAVYRLCSLLEHNCTPNTHRSISSETLLLTVRAACDIPKGTHLSTSYCDIFWPTQRRQNSLSLSKFFVCKCERCLDPTEFGSYFSAFVCPLCPRLSPVIPHLKNEDNNSSSSYKEENTFRCTNCHQEWNFLDDGLQEIQQKADKELEELEYQLKSGEEVPEEPQDLAVVLKCSFKEWIERWSIFPTEEILQELSEQNKKDGAVTAAIDQQGTKSPKYPNRWILYPQHSVVWDACHTLCLLYSYGETVPVEEMNSKILLGIFLLQSTANLTKGISKFRGSVMGEMALTRFCVLIHRVGSGAEIDDDLRSYARESIKMMKDGLEHLKYEPQDQPEGGYYTTGLNKLSQFQHLLGEYI